jgi:hypothetical protein
MKKLPLLVAVCCAVVFAFSACKKTDQINTVTNGDEISLDVKARISDMGFRTDEMSKTEGGYIVEGDIFLSEDEVNHPLMQVKALIVANTEQYRTTNLVTGLPRNIKVWISTTLPTSYATATDVAIARYNAEGLLVTFTRQTSSSGANISITKAPNGASYLASAGFPSGGNPYNSIKVNSNYLGSNPGTNYLATILAHEMGHCIGFRHTDYMNRSYSCGGAYYNEGSAGVGAIHIPGTPTGPDANSWMLACIGAGVNRPFNTNDKTALNYIY